MRIFSVKKKRIFGILIFSFLIFGINIFGIFLKSNIEWDYVLIILSYIIEQLSEWIILTRHVQNRCNLIDPSQIFFSILSLILQTSCDTLDWLNLSSVLVSKGLASHEARVKSEISEYISVGMVRASGYLSDIEWILIGHGRLLRSLDGCKVGSIVAHRWNAIVKKCTLAY